MPEGQTTEARFTESGLLISFLRFRAFNSRPAETDDFEELVFVDEVSRITIVG
jgi:hypothetical protein